MMRKKLMCMLGLIVALTMSSQAQITIMSDDFSSGTFTHKIRVFEADIDNGWLSPWQSGVVTSEWAVVSGQMVNSATTPGNYPTNMPAEGPLVQVVTTSATNDLIEIVFDYSVASGDTLYLHFWGLDGTYDIDGQFFANHQGGNGSLSPAGNSDDGVVKYNLTDGSVASASTPIPPLTGSGTYSNTISIAGLGIAGITTTADFEYILVGFAKQEDGTAGTTWIDNLSISAVEAPAGAFQENPVFPEENVLVSQLDYNNVGSVRWTGTGGQNAGLGQSFKFGTAQTLRAITFQKGGSVGFPVSGTNELKLWVGQYDSTSDPLNHVVGTTLHTQLFDVTGQTFVDGNFYTINLPSDIGLSAGVEYAFELAFSSQDATHTFNINRYYEGAGGNDKYADGTIVYQQNIDGGVPFVSLINEPENDMTFGLHSTIIGTYAYLTADPAEIALVFDSTSVNLATGSVDVAFNSATNMDITITVSDESDPGSFRVLSATNQTLTTPLVASTLEFEFDNTVAILAAGSTATGLATIAWSEVGGGASGSVVVPLSAFAAFPDGQVNVFNGGGDGVNWGDAANWSLSRVPGTLGADKAILQSPGLQVTVATNFTATFAPQILIRNNVSGSTLNIAADLLNIGDFNVGFNDGYMSFVNQSAGTATASYLQMGDINDGTFNPSNSVYTLTGGEMIADKVKINDSGVIDIDGGTFTINNAGQDNKVSGIGLIKLQSGELRTTATVASDVDNYECAFEISGGTVNIGHQAYYTGGITIIGDAATVNIDYMNANSVVNFELGANGVSTIDGTGAWATLASATFNIDGSAYTGGSADLVLHKSNNTTPNSTNLTVNVTGFAADYGTSVTIDEGNNNQVVLHITLGGYAGWANDYGVGASTTNEDGDVLNNLYEYGLGGDPTNSLDIGTEPLLENGTGGLDYVHVRRVAATNEISYYLETKTDLVFGTWSNIGYSVTGYGPVVGDFDTVTNQIDTSVDARFIKLIIEEL